MIHQLNQLIRNWSTSPPVDNPASPPLDNSPKEGKVGGLEPNLPIRSEVIFV